MELKRCKTINDSYKKDIERVNTNLDHKGTFIEGVKEEVNAYAEKEPKNGKPYKFISLK